jgi:hypothetical protein
MRLRLASNGLVAKQEAHGAAALAFAHEQLSAKLAAKRAKLEAVQSERAVWTAKCQDLASTAEVPRMRKRVAQLQQVVLRVRRDAARV